MDAVHLISILQMWHIYKLPMNTLPKDGEGKRQKRLNPDETSTPLSAFMTNYAYVAKIVSSKKKVFTLKACLCVSFSLFENCKANQSCDKRKQKD